MPFYKIIFFAFFIVLSQQIQAIGTTELLPVEQAYTVSAKAINANQLEVSWDIAEGYYLYRSKTHIVSISENIQLGMLEIPAGKSKQDAFFGDVEIYREQLKIRAPIINHQNLHSLDILVSYQGCADIGVCYPPQQKTFSINLAATNLPKTVNNIEANLFNNLSAEFKNLKRNLFQDELLPAEQAFQFFATVKDAHTLHLNWVLAEGYYLYKDKIKLSLNQTATVQLGDFSIPQGKPYHDEIFGDVQIFHGELSFDVPLLRNSQMAESITLLAEFQGCADRGVCYPPMEKSIELQIPLISAISIQKNSTPITKQALSEQDKIFQSLKSDSFALILLSFFGFGLLLAFTPCIFPMIPILSGIIVGQGESITGRKAFLLSLCYVIASALTYTVFGILAALFGSNLQVAFQEPWIIVVFSSIFILLAFSMFGFYNLELPKSLQARIHNNSDRHRNGSYLGAAIMGALSSLIIGPCVAAPLAGALIYIGQTGDVVLGGSALFLMGLGMGIPLLILGASVGKLLPKAGHWLNYTKAIFGVLMLAVAVWMLDRILPTSITMLLSATLLIIPAIYLRALEPLSECCSGWNKLWKGTGILMLIYGILLLIGLSMGNTHLLQPLKGLANNISQQQKEGIHFARIDSIAELEQVLELASINKQWVMLDFYADWCISCKEMEAFTFTDARVKQALSNFILIQADVTKNSADDKALLKRFNLFGPPAIIFFTANKQEQKNARVIGYQDSDTFLSGINQLLSYE
ncbi:MAG: protein-disulfide reductase DsbD [Methylococcales symbiont of Iophon sp. n. MRB-2018]|nr:MAG: protein-disulfide reductase DsbD [Methylococcales symbiont of Iophon sp. n. MRB-2018]KAF3979726.1 MAG: protein-disulfide reductase DsbD [Methylococcales symbiont of Iophon sp. n. MRB-2018]